MAGDRLECLEGWFESRSVLRSRFCQQGADGSGFFVFTEKCRGKIPAITFITTNTIGAE
jgi:hypothetical protein